ncbi:MerR family transcriptional regulator [Arthrobacter sp. VKM Ac-2550]|uniref:MerR family transcriptional regulator n=1 Tax=Crystallibacter permensis TaxID=1938888 RepID=UPI002227B163|nr:MerR family transcriptional regulator [Arthrobacter sp. VKM Ac-2550]MCW2135443.1 MerR HTH family regulatory protein [Arthrobacter sp. VKM Ac-2550]
MAFDVRLTAVLTGTTVPQLRRWRQRGIFEPELPDSEAGALQYSYRDLMALRAIAFLRAKVSLQKIRAALSVLRKLSYNDHLSAYTFGADGRSVGVHLVISVLIGLAYGALWWVLGPLVIMPLMLGMPLFTMDAMAMLSLMGHLVYGLVLALVAVRVLKPAHEQ